MKQRSPFTRRPSALKVRNADEGTTEILLYDEVGFFGVDARTFVLALRDITTDQIDLRINSPGGDVFDGVAIYNALVEHDARIVTHIDGLAASIASVIAMAGDEIKIAENAFMMIHDPWGVTIGTAADHRETANLLDKITESSIVRTYVARTGQGVDDVRELMAAETWFTAEEAVENGFADEAVEAKSVSDKFDLSVFGNVPDSLRDRDSRPTIRDVEHILREAGLSNWEAKAVASAGMKALDVPRDGGSKKSRDAVEPGVLVAAMQLANTMNNKQPGVSHDGTQRNHRGSD